MSLLQKATIITTPTAHSNGVLHSIKGGSVADFDVVRGSAATRVNAEGLIEDISTLSAELVTNGDFSTDSNWTKGTGFSINSGSANCDGTQTANTEIKQQGGILGSTINFVVGKTYKVNFDIIVTSGQISNIEVASGYDSNAITTSGNHTTYITAVSTNNRFTITASPSFVGSIDNVSVVEVIDATNIPRLDYTDGTASILLEPQSTNLVPYSEDFSQSSWLQEGGATLGLNTYLSPSGQNNASELNLPSTLSRITYVFNSTGVHSFSVYLRSDTDGTISIKAAAGSPSVEQQLSLTSQWQRFNILVTDGNYWQVVKAASDTLTSVYIWGAQLEALPYSTSYIPTSGAIATRLADSITGAGDASTFNSTEGVLYAEVSNVSKQNYSNISLTDGTNSQRIQIYFNKDDLSLMFFIRVDGVILATHIVSSSGINYEDTNKIAIKYKTNDMSFWLNGTKVGTNTSGTLVPNKFTKLGFNSGGGGAFYGKTKALAVWKEALSDQELECLTTI